MRSGGFLALWSTVAPRKAKPANVTGGLKKSSAQYTFLRTGFYGWPAQAK
jgi:hypothetical protein